MRLIANFRRQFLETLAGAVIALAAGLWQPAQAGDFEPAVGNWLNPDSVGWGLDLQRIGNIIFVLWFTYREDGSPIWYLAVGTLDEDAMSWTGNIDEFSWDVGEAQSTPESVGTMTIVWSDEENALLSWTLNKVSHTLPIEFLTFAGGTTEIDHTGHYFPPDQPGWGASVLTQGVISAMFLYFYDAEGEPVWALGNALEAGFVLIFPLALFDGPGLCPSCLAEKGDPDPATSEPLIDVSFAAIRRPFLETNDEPFTTAERLAGVNSVIGTINPDTPLGADPLSAIALSVGVAGLGPFQTLAPLTPEHHSFTQAQFNYLDRSQRLNYDPGVFNVPARCIGSLVVNIDFEAPGAIGYPRSFVGGTPFTLFVPGLGESDPIASGMSLAGEDTVVVSWMAYWPLAGVTEGLMLVGRNSAFFDNPANGIDVQQVVSVRTGPAPIIKGPSYASRVELVVDSGILPLLCARVANP